MNHESSTQLDPGLVTVLRAVAQTNLSAGPAIAKNAGGATRGALHALRLLEYICEHAGQQRDGAATKLYSLTAKGAAALAATGGEVAEALPPVAAPRTSGPSAAIYDGAEMRQYGARPGAMDAFRFPSRMGNRLVHPDGSVSEL
ncbi:hypothetical protein WKW80_36875 [Variovorax humicola]|uniref:Uncharacterized protein n=1 Tax=Variovorax humicola TaxID=1769758 RepID=A0ABU8WBZ8_9BURK